MGTSRWKTWRFLSKFLFLGFLLYVFFVVRSSVYLECVLLFLFHRLFALVYPYLSVALVWQVKQSVEYFLKGKLILENKSLHKRVGQDVGRYEQVSRLAVVVPFLRSLQPGHQKIVYKFFEGFTWHEKETLLGARCSELRTGDAHDKLKKHVAGELVVRQLLDGAFLLF